MAEREPPIQPEDQNPSANDGSDLWDSTPASDPGPVKDAATVFNSDISILKSKKSGANKIAKVGETEPKEEKESSGGNESPVDEFQEIMASIKLTPPDQLYPVLPPDFVRLIPQNQIIKVPVTLHFSRHDQKYKLWRVRIDVSFELLRHQDYTLEHRDRVMKELYTYLRDGLFELLRRNDIDTDFMFASLRVFSQPVNKQPNAYLIAHLSVSIDSYLSVAT